MPRKRKSDPVDPQWVQRVKLLEEFAALDREVQNFKPRLTRHEKLRELILDWYSGAKPEDEITVRTLKYDIVVTARDKIRWVTDEGKAKLYKLWGSRDFIARCVMYLKSLPDPEDKKGLYTVSSLSGPRHLRVIDRPAAADPAA